MIKMIQKIIKHKKPLIIVLVLLLTVPIFIMTTQCKLDGQSVCFNRKTNAFEIEENAVLNVQVENEAMGEYLVDTWDTLYPDFKGAITPVVKAPLTLTELADDFPADIIITSINNAAYILNEVVDLDKEAARQILSKSPRSMQNSINIKGTYFIPNSVKGWTFVYNKTLLEEMNIDLKDENNNGLPDSFETWESLLGLDKVLLEQVDIVFPLSFKDQYSFYPFLTGGKWHLNFTNKGSDPGFSHPEFLKGLELIEAFSQVTLNKTLEDEKADNLVWEYNTAFFERRTAFSLLSDWMQFDYNQSLTEDEYIRAPMPSFHGTTLSPKGEVDGYLVSNKMLYPSAATEVLRILRSFEVAPLYTSATDKTFVYHRDYIEELTVDKKTKEKMLALNFTHPDPVMVLEENTAVLSRNLLYEVDLMPVLRELFDGVITKEEAQNKISALGDAWVEAQRVEKTDELD